MIIKFWIIFKANPMIRSDLKYDFKKCEHLPSTNNNLVFVRLSIDIPDNQ